MNEWNICKLEEGISIKHGYAFKGEYFSSQGEKIILTPGNFFETGGFKYTPGKEKYFISEFPQEYLCKKNDLIIAMTEQAAGLLGSTALVPIDDLFLHNQRIGLIKIIHEKFDKIFLNYLFRTKAVREQIIGSASGTKVKHTSPLKILDVKVKVPNLHIQKLIGKVLSDLDAKIELNHKINAELEAMSKLIYDYWFVQFEFPNEEGKPYKSSGGKMVWDEELKREVPEGWEVKQLKDIIIKNVDKHIIDNKVYDTVDLSVMPSGSFCLSDRNKSDSFGTNLFKLKKNDLLFGAIRPYLLKAGFAPFDGLVTGTVHSFRCKKDHYFNFSLLTMTHSSMFKFAISNCKGTKMPVIGATEILGYKIPFNESTVEKFNRTIILKDIISKNINENQKLSELRDWLLPMLMNGQVKVSEL
jgi:type I restriction enzyme S subunit